MIDKKHLAATFKRFRELQGLSHKQLVERSKQAITYYDLSHLEAGRSALTSTKKREALARGFGVPADLISALAELRITPEQAAKFAAQPEALLASADPSEGARKQGEELAVFTQLAHVRKSRFPHLELCLLYHEANGKKWPPQVVETARSGDFFGPKDLPTPGDWRNALDALEHSLKMATTPKPDGDKKIL